MKLKDKMFNGLVFSGFLVVIAIVAAFMFQDILGYQINLFKKEVIEEETTITVVEEETTALDTSKLPKLEDMLAEHERDQKKKAAAKAKAEANKKETETTFPAETVAETQVAKLEIPEEKPTVITNGEKTGIITNPVVDDKGNVSQKPVETTAPKATEPTTTAPDNNKSKEETPTNSGNAALDAWEDMWKNAEGSGAASIGEEFKGELTGEYTGW